MQPVPVHLPVHLPLDDGHVVPLRPYGAGQLFTGAGRVLVRAPRPWIVTGLLVAALTMGARLATGPLNTVHRDVAGDLVTHFHPWGLLPGLVLLLTVPILQAVAGQVALSLTAGTLPNEWRTYRRALRLFPLLLGIEIVRALTLGILGLFVVGIALFVQWSLAGYVVLAEDKRVLDALRRSADLVRGSWWRVFGLLLLVSFVTSGAAAVPQVVFATHPDDPTWQFWGTVTAAILTIPVYAFGAAYVALLYVDLRCRNEGLAWKLDAARRGPEREPFGPGGVYAELPWQPRSRR